MKNYLAAYLQRSPEDVKIPIVAKFLSEHPDFRPFEIPKKDLPRIPKLGETFNFNFGYEF